ncbi:hypothetical protein CUR178_06741 [Leishmania enriettii]|uniref:Uncharacterized protein n=1 Tax=Leishmania enriettii TaxID=5663 RepID=A0A836KPC6_LEIEN|nr:hypothetical protein CUR178_06741 [Leishmania enriettii]
MAPTSPHAQTEEFAPRNARGASAVASADVFILKGGARYTGHPGRPLIFLFFPGLEGLGAT